MKFVRRHGQTLRFELGKRERRLLLHALQLYPQLDVAHQRLTKAEKTERHTEAEDLRQEILSDHQRECRQLIGTFIGDKLGGTAEVPGSTAFPLALTRAQAEWLLEVLNDVRVGTWVRLGQPDEASLLGVTFNAENVARAAAMEYCAYFQSLLLEVLDDGE